MSAIDLSGNWSIVVMQSHPTANLAARELADYLQHIGGQPVGVVHSVIPQQPYFLLDFFDNHNDGFTWSAEERIVRLTGNNPRGLLYAVYDFLEELGCCWFGPGVNGETIPSGTTFTLPDQPVTEEPAFPGRCLIIGHDAFMQDVRDWIIWAGRNRLNVIFFHTTTGALALGAVPESRYRDLKPIFLPLMQERGMTLEHGGHGLTELLPRAIFALMPDAFRVKDGRRTPDHNFCPSSREGMQIIRKNAERHFREHPEVDVFHLWGDDIPGGGWCGCADCLKYSASDQLLLAINEIADVLAEVNPAAQISMIAYHDTEAVPTGVRPRSNVHMLWAPRMRCYAHPLDDSTCRVNMPKYVQTLQSQVNYFSASGASPARVFEYYLDAVLFKSVIPPLPTVMHRDAVCYRDAGVNTMQALMTGDYAWTAPQLNVWLYPRLVWNPGQNPDILLTQFCRAAYGVDLSVYYRCLEQAFSIALDIAPEQIDIRENDSKHLWHSPPADMGDPVFAPLSILQEKMSHNNALRACLDAAQSELEKATPFGNSRMEQEKEYFQLVKSWLEFHLYRLGLYTAVASGTKEEISSNWHEANKAIKQVYRWGRQCISSPKHRVNFHFIQYYCWNIRLNKIRAEQLCTGLGCIWLEMVTKLQLVYQYSRLRHMYDVRKKGNKRIVRNPNKQE